MAGTIDIAVLSGNGCPRFDWGPDDRLALFIQRNLLLLTKEKYFDIKLLYYAMIKSLLLIFILRVEQIYMAHPSSHRTRRN